MTLPPVVRIAAPVVAPEPPRPGFPVVATVAPVVVAGVLFAVTGSPFMLLMAAFGPVIAGATLVDGRRQRRRARREAAARFDVELEAVRRAVDDARAAELARRRGFASVDPDWSDGERPPVIAVSRGDEPSGVELTGGSSPAGPAVLEQLRVEAATLAGAPVLREAVGGFAIRGPAVVAAAVARTLAVRLAARLSPAVASLAAPEDEEWARRLPHAVEPAPPGIFRWRVAEREIVLTWGVPPEPGTQAVDALAAEATTRETARRVAERLAETARTTGVRAPGGDLPDAVALASLLAAATSPRPGLAAPLGVGADGVVELDLVADGPHAVVAGTTGSGKSELLVSWVLGMAAGRSPAEVAFVLVDFKGGAAFAPLAGLPHVLGTLSDLDERLARRAIESLRAEVLRRERALAAAGVRAIEELPPAVLARLVVVVDEFAALLAERGELHALFADLAARGRSLGIHLVLCTQRPAGVVRDAVLANIAVRIALRVADRGDSLGLLGDDSAARLPAAPRGRAVVVDGSGVRRTVQIALASPDDVERLAAATPAAEVPRPWCDPLPAVVPFEELPSADGVAFGLIDLPAEQRQPVALLRPRDGHLLVLGAPGSGVSTALATIATSAGDLARRLPDDPVRLWAVLAEHGALDDGAVLLADDLDLVLARCGPDHALELVELVARLLREAPGRGIRVVAGARRLAGSLHALAPHFGSRLLLRLSSREEHVLAGGDGASYDPRAHPGAGSWDGAVVQVALSSGAPCREVDAPPPVVVRVAERGELAIVAARPRELAERWDARRVRVRLLGAPDDGLRVDPDRTVLLGDPDAWQADWAELARARRDLRMLVHGCAPADLRALTRSREVPPPLAPGEVWLVEHGRVHRAVLDDAAIRAAG